MEIFCAVDTDAVVKRIEEPSICHQPRTAKFGQRALRYSRFLETRFREASRAPQNPVLWRANEAEMGRRRRNGSQKAAPKRRRTARAPLTHASSSPAKWRTPWLRWVNLASFLDLRVVQNVETAYIYGKSQNAASPPAARERDGAPMSFARRLLSLTAEGLLGVPATKV